jgi:hypothetical protein
MADIPKIKRNIRRMLDQGAPETDIDAYVASEGVTAEQLRAHAAQSVNAQGKSDSERFSRTDSAILGGADTAAFGFADEIAGLYGGVLEGLGRPEGFKGSYERVRDNSRRVLQGAQEVNPGSYLGGQVGGAVLTGFVPGAQAIRAPTLAGKVAQGAKVGGAQGAAYGAGSAEGDLAARAQGAGEGALVGGLIGTAAPVVGNKLGKMLLNPAKGAPSPQAVSATTDALYDQLRNAGIRYDANAYERFARDLVSDLRKRGFRPRDSSTIAADVKDILSQVGTSPDYAELESLRKAVGNLPKGASDLDMSLAAAIREKLDTFLERAPFIHDGTARNAPQLMKQAREMASRNIKNRLLEKAIEKARDAPSGFENGLKNEFASLLRNQGRRFTAAEKEAIRKVSHRMGGQNLLRLLSQFGIDFRNLGGSSNLLAVLGGGGLGAASNPALGAGLVAAGTIAKPVAAANAERLARQAQGVMRLGKAGQARALQRRLPYQRAATGLLANQTGAVEGGLLGDARYRRGGLLGLRAR